jgi:type IV pilus assembly protein PilC
LPDITKILIGQSDAVVNFWYLTVPLLSPIAAIILIMEYGDAVGWRLASQRLLGGFVARVYTPDLLRSLSHAVAAEQNLEVTLEGILHSSAAPELKNRLKSVLLELQQGMPCWNELGQHGFLRGGEVALLETAEKAGNLDWTLNAIADAIERRWSYRMYALMETYSPIVVLVPGFIVGFVVISLFMPLIKLLNDLS